MCLVVVAWQQSSDYPLIVAGNRDEFHARPTQDMHWWADEPDILGGRDLQAGGTWLATHRNGRFATVTNYRDAQQERGTLLSRGNLVTEFLRSDTAPVEYLSAIDGERYAGFNLLVCDGETLAYSSNRGADARELAPGIYGLGNALLDSDWHKVRRAKQGLQQLLERDRVNESTLFRLLNDREMAPAECIESERLPFETAHAISAPFIVLPDYGTRCSTVLLRKAGGRTTLHERRFDPAGRSLGDSAFAID